MRRCNKVPPCANGVIWLCIILFKGRNCFVVGLIWQEVFLKCNSLNFSNECETTRISYSKICSVVTNFFRHIFLKSDGRFLCILSFVE